LSVAFTKEDSAETASETLLPDRPVSPHPNLVTEAGLKALEFQLNQAREAYEAAQKIEDVNERRRQAASPLRPVALEGPIEWISNTVKSGRRIVQNRLLVALVQMVDGLSKGQIKVTIVRP